MTDVREIAMLARAPTTNFDEAVALIESYADLIASAAVVKAVTNSNAHMLSAFDLINKAVAVQK